MPKTDSQTSSKTVMVCALYQFIRITNHADNHPQFQRALLERMQAAGIRGTLLLASEGINGTIAGNSARLIAFVQWLQGLPWLQGKSKMQIKTSFTDELPFKRSRVKLKKEIVTMGVDGIDPIRAAGTYVDPENWNALIDDADVVVIDTRNEYEIAVGRFENSVNPRTTHFREFPKYVQENLASFKGKKVAMYCTGGIRCEKSTALLKGMGVENVYHLKGGILKYLQNIPRSETRWQGECFVFDERVTVDHELQKGSYDQCHACRLPIADTDKQHPQYQAGVSCPYCYGHKSDADIKRYAEREKQVLLAESRGDTHIGAAD